MIMRSEWAIEEALQARLKSKQSKKAVKVSCDKSGKEKFNENHGDS